MTSAPRSLFETLRETAARHPDTSAFTFVGSDRRTIAAGELMSSAEALGERLRRRRLDARLPFGVLLRRQEDQVVHYLAALAAGVVPAILTPPNRKLNREYYLETTAAVLARCGFSAIVTDVDGLDIPNAQLAPHTLEQIDRGLGGDAQPRDCLEGIAFLQFSSGTTGIKRGVPMTVEAVTAQLRTYAAALSLTRSDVILSWLPLYHDMGFIACLNMPLAHGVHCVMVDPVDWVTAPAVFPQLVGEFGATLAWNPNFSYSFMAQRIHDRDLEGVDLTTLRGLVNCSEPATWTSQDRFRERFQPYGLRPDVFWGCYAMAETTFALTHGTPSDDLSVDRDGPTDGTVLAEPYQISVGRPLPGVDIYIAAPDGDPLPNRHVGELWVRSPFNFRAYYGDPDATASSHADGFYRTGDLGYRVGDAFFVTGRKKDVLIVGGANIFPHDIEELVGGTAGAVAGRVSAFARFDPQAQTERVTVLFESDLEEREAMRVVVAARQRVAAALDLTAFDLHRVPPGWLVKSSSGKIARSANREKWERSRTAPDQL